MSLLSLTTLLNSLALLQARGRTWWMPQESSTVAKSTDDLFYFIYYISLFFFVLIVIALAVFIWRYRERPGHVESPSPHHNFALEVTWSVIPLILVIFIFWWGYTGFLNVITPPPNAYEIQVTAQQWQWSFQYPNGYVDTDLHAPAGRPIVLTMSSVDVIHSLFIPDFRIKQDVVPGRYTKCWFNAPQPGEHVLTCAEYCGAAKPIEGEKEHHGHSYMRCNCIVLEPAEFDKWLAGADAATWGKLSPVDAGKLVYERFGCKQCHSADGTVGTGPSWKGVFGSQVALNNGQSVQADENYVRESIEDPAAKVVKGFDPVMPTFKGRLKDKQILGVIAYLKTLAK